jgi:AcrR family transcriptional regulator
MAPDVKRSYDGTARRAASTRTRQRILQAGSDLIVEVGYRTATIAAIAARADVSVATVYELVGRKPTILRELIEQAISGTDHAVAADDRDYVRAIAAEPDAAAKLVVYAAAVTRILQRMAPLFLALRDASSTEPDAQDVWSDISRRRAANMRRFAAELAATGQLRRGLHVDDVADVIWATNSAEFYTLFTVERGWTPRRFQTWLTDSWQRMLLEEVHPHS